MGCSESIRSEGYCPFCGGSGTTRFKHIANGDCFRCAGTGRLAINTAPTHRAKPASPEEMRRISLMHCRNSFAAMRQQLGTEEGAWLLCSEGEEDLAALRGHARGLPTADRERVVAAFRSLGLDLEDGPLLSEMRRAS